MTSWRECLFCGEKYSWDSENDDCKICGHKTEAVVGFGEVRNDDGLGKRYNEEEDSEKRFRVKIKL